MNCVDSYAYEVMSYDLCLFLNFREKILVYFKPIYCIAWQLTIAKQINNILSLYR